MKHLFIVNPKAGGQDRTEAVRIAAREIYGDDFEIYVTKCPGDATREVRQRGESGEEYFIYSCGGDGTFNECCNGACGHMNLSIAPYPVGTGNDFCRMFGSESNLFTNLDALSKGTSRPMDLIDCGNGVMSANLCSVGFDARVGCNVHNYTHLPLCKGSLAYVVSLIVELTKGINCHMRIKCGDVSLEGKYALACVCNGRYYGGGFMPSRDAMPDDGEFDIYIAKAMNFPTLAMNLGKYSSGRSDEIPKHIIHLKGDSISFDFDEDMLVNVDGESVYARRLDLTMRHHCMNLVVPEGMKFFD